jgi:hypothetical protein
VHPVVIGSNIPLGEFVDWLAEVGVEVFEQRLVERFA